MFNNNGIHPFYKIPYPFEPHFYTWATFHERLEYPDLKTKFLLLADYLLPFSECRSLEEWGSVIDKLLQGKKVEPHLTVPAYHYRAEAYNELATDPRFSAPSIGQDHMNNFEFAENKAEYLKSLVQLAEKKTKKIVLLQPPVRKEYMDVIYNNPKYLETYKEVLQFIHSLENEKVHSIIWETPKDCGLDDSIFIDYGHFNIKGAYTFTHRLYHELKKMGILEPEASNKS